jgi:hypothetical protein
MAYMVSGSKSKAFRQWADNVAELIRHEGIVRIFLYRITLGKAASAVTLWHTKVQEKKALQAQVGPARYCAKP